MEQSFSSSTFVSVKAKSRFAHFLFFLEKGRPFPGVNEFAPKHRISGGTDIRKRLCPKNQRNLESWVYDPVFFASTLKLVPFSPINYIFIGEVICPGQWRFCIVSVKGMKRINEAAAQLMFYVGWAWFWESICAAAAGILDEGCF